MNDAIGKDLKQVWFLQLFMMTGIVVPWFVVYFLLPADEQGVEYPMTLLPLVVFALIAAQVAAFPFIRKSLVAEHTGKYPISSSTRNPSTDMILFRSIIIVKSALIEGASFLGIIAYCLSQQVACLAVPVVCLALMLKSLPTVEQFSNFSKTLSDTGH